MPGLEEGRNARLPNLVEWLDRDADSWKTALKGSALRRTRRAGLLRNAALVLGERRAAEAEPALARRLMDAGEDPAVKSAAAWAWGVWVRRRRVPPWNSTARPLDPGTSSIDSVGPSGSAGGIGPIGPRPDRLVNFESPR